LAGIGSVGISKAASGFFLDHYAVLAENPRRAKGVLTATYSCPRQYGPTLKIWIPVMPTYAGQRDVNTTVELVDKRIQLEAFRPESMDQDFFFCTLTPDHFDSSGKFTIRTTYSATLLDTRLQQTTAILDVAKKPSKFLTRSSATVDYSSAEFQSFLKEKIESKREAESPIMFVLRAWGAIQPLYGHEFITEPGTRLASKACRLRQLECNTTSTLMVAICRANGIPARLLSGRNTRSDPHQYGTTHHRMEFFDPNTGWIPMESDFYKSPSDLRANFARIPKSLMVLAKDSDFDLPLFGTASQVQQTANHYHAMWKFDSRGSKIDWNQVRAESNWAFSWL
jgi:hypothetical protein